MKKTFFITACYCLLSFTFAIAQQFHFSGKISSQDSLVILFGTERKIDTLISPNGELRFSRELEHPELLVIAACDVKSYSTIGLCRFFAAPGTGSLQTTVERLGTSEVQLSDPTSNIIYNDFRSRFNPLVSIARKIIDTSYSKQLTTEGTGLCNKLYEYVNSIEDQVIEAFIRNNSNNFVGAYILGTYFKKEKDIQKTSILYNAFPASIQASAYLKGIPAILENAEKNAVGSHAPFAKATSINGEAVSFGPALHKYTVIDFWGSWCGPCIRGIGKMKTYYEKYKNDVVFVGIAYNDNKSAVQKVITENGIPWTQIINEDQQTNWVKQFNIYAAPTKIVIGRDGTILRYFVGESEEFYSYLDGLGLK
ncbi:TlpA family protein disulfide reductase [Chitinophaga sp. NPDC101104]|uniref:TlpA family protein disulfide reductase n=1 Tax=Chitinophaga sp. NPDC101104 TaxID=3390561 RepID=UPI003D01F117